MYTTIKKSTYKLNIIDQIGTNAWKHYIAISSYSGYFVI